MKILKFLKFLILGALVLTGCDFDSKVEQQEKAIVNVKVEDVSNNARTVFPNVSINNISDIVLSYQNENYPETQQKKWDSVSDIISFELDEGVYNFSLTAKCSGFNYYAEIKSFEIKVKVAIILFHFIFH